MISPEPSGRFYVEAVPLPHGRKPALLWIADGRIVDGPLPDARRLPGGFVAPGLVDAHAHLTMDFSRTGLRRGQASMVAANREAHARAGVLLVRDAGWVPEADVDALWASGACQVDASGRLLAPAERFHGPVYEPVAPDDLIRVALAQVETGLRWVKVIADFPGADGDFFAAPPTYAPELIARLTREVHAAGARVMVHSSGPNLAELVAAGVDSVEHGNAMTPELVRVMAGRGVAWTPTVATIESYVGRFAADPGPLGQRVRDWRATLDTCLPLAVELGVAILVGSDELAHGSLAVEMAAMARRGLSAEQVLAAATATGRGFLGAPTLTVGAPADLVTWTEDPRRDLARLATPAAVLSQGRPVAAPLGAAR